MGVWGLLPCYTRQQPSDTSNFYLHNVDHGFVSGATTRKRLLAFWKNRKLDQPGLWRGREHGYCCLRRTRLDVLHQGEHQPIGEVGWQLKLLVQNFLFAITIRVVNRDLPRRSVDRCFHGLFERRPPLHEVIAQKSEAPSLSKYSPVLVNRTIFEAKDQVGGNAISLCDLRHLTVRDLFAFQGAQRKKAMH